MLIGENSTSGILITATFVSIGIACFFISFYFIKKNSIVWLFVVVLILLSFLVFPFSSNYRFADLFLILNYLGISLLPLFLTLNYKLYRAISYITLGFFLSVIFSGVAPDDLFSTSRNFVSVLLLIVIGFYIIACHQNTKNPNPIILILSLFVAVWAIGRAGIFVFTVLLIILPLVSNYKLKYKFLLVITILSTAFYLYFIFQDSLFVTALYRIQNMGMEDVRSSMNAEYLHKTFESLSHVLVGTPLYSLETLKEVDYNPHNSFIRLHIFFGFWGFCMVSVLIIISFLKYLRRKDFLFLILLFAITFRSSVDSTAFHGPLDPLYFFLIFYPFKDKYIKPIK